MAAECGCWEPNLGPLVSNKSTESTPQPPDFWLFVDLETGLSIPLAVLKLTTYNMLSWNSQRLACLWRLSVEIKSMYVFAIGPHT